MKTARILQTRLGEIGLAENEGAITNIFFRNTVMPRDYLMAETPLLNEAGRQLTEYFEGGRRDFDLPLSPEGTEFERQVWDALLTIPFGQVRSYKDIAVQIGRPKACRAVGRANGLNPIGIVIPCHRVIGADGRLTGYAGGLEFKEALLQLEGSRL